MLFCCILSAFDLTQLILMMLFYAAVRKDSVILLKFSFFSHVQISYKISLVCCLEYPFRLISSHFCSLVIVHLILELFLFCLLSIIRLSLLFSNLAFKSLYRCIDVIFSAVASSFTFLFFLDINLLSCLGCKALNIVLWSIS